MRIRNIAVLVMAALGTMSLAVGCSSAKKDQDLATTIKAQMFSDPQVKAADVNVSVKDGEATLTGDVPDDTARYRAYKLASDTPGVKHVVDKMTAESAAVPPPPLALDPTPVAPPSAESNPRIPGSVRPNHCGIARKRKLPNQFKILKQLPLQLQR